jgi:hypothetical protein
VAGAAAVAADVLAGAFCWVAAGGVWVAGDVCCARRGKLPKASRVVTSAVLVFMKSPPSVPALPHPHVRDTVTRCSLECKRRAKPEQSHTGLSKRLRKNRLLFGKVLMTPLENGIRHELYS